MEISPEARQFGDIEPFEETEEQRERFAKLCEEGKIVARGPKDSLEKLQERLRTDGWTPIVPR
jgi:hypothetical protein